MKPLVIYHANCADGFGAAFAAWLKLGDEAEYLPMQYGPTEEEWFGRTFCTDEVVSTLDNREIYILDFSLPRRHMDYIFAEARRVVWLDHHKTAFEMWCPHERKHYVFDDAFKFIDLNNDKSGALIAWEYFHPDTEVPMLIQHIDDRDRWQFKLEGTKELNAALFTSSWNFPQWQELMHADIAPMYKAGKATLRAHDQNVQSVVKGSARKCSINHQESKEWSHTGWPWVNGLAANCPPHLTSDVGHELATKSGTFGLCWTLSQEGLIAKCSLRSNGEYDVSAIAKVFGGGGHSNAAGFEVPIQTLLGWLKC